MKHCLYLLIIFANITHASDVIRLEGISIQGNSEEPNVMYITPWQVAPGTGRLYTPVYSYREHWLKPISKDVIKRETKYLNHFNQKDSFTPEQYNNK